MAAEWACDWTQMAGLPFLCSITCPKLYGTRHNPILDKIRTLSSHVFNQGAQFAHNSAKNIACIFFSFLRPAPPLHPWAVFPRNFAPKKFRIMVQDKSGVKIALEACCWRLAVCRYACHLFQRLCLFD